jgi:hypothetical protein
MSKWPMRGHFRYLRFETFPMTPRTPQWEVFWPLLSNSKHSGVPEDSKSPTLGVLGFTPTLGQSGVATGTPLGVWGFIPSHSPTLLKEWNVTLELSSWPAPLQALALVANPRLGSWQMDKLSLLTKILVRYSWNWWMRTIMIRMSTCPQFYYLTKLFSRLELGTLHFNLFMIIPITTCRTFVTIESQVKYMIQNLPQF